MGRLGGGRRGSRLGTLGDHHRDGEPRVVRQREVPAPDPASRRVLGRAAGEAQRRRCTRRPHDLDVDPADAARPARAEDLHHRFLGGEATGQALRRARPPRAVRLLLRGVDAIEEALAAPGADLFDALDLGQVDADAEYGHVWARCAGHGLVCRLSEHTFGRNAAATGRRSPAAVTPRPATSAAATADGEYLSIGDVADATGFTPDTLRVWERRYGGPVPVRLPSGHRRYTREQVIWLRRVAEAIAMSHRPSKVLRLSKGELGRLLESRLLEDARAEDVRQLLALAREHRDVELRHRLDLALRQGNVVSVLQGLVAPLLVAVGRTWASEELGIRHEHGLVELLADWLRQLRAAREPRTAGPLVAFATLEGERHALGIQMAAVVAAERGHRVKLLGSDLPWQEIELAALELRAQIVLIGISLSSGGIETDRMVAQLRQALPPVVTLAIGGAGARSVRRGPRGVECLDGLSGLDQWLAQRAPQRRPASLL